VKKRIPLAESSQVDLGSQQQMTNLAEEEEEEEELGEAVGWHIFLWICHLKDVLQLSSCHRRPVDSTVVVVFVVILALTLIFVFVTVAYYPE
jgi:hypothetical protein